MSLGLEKRPMQSNMGLISVMNNAQIEERDRLEAQPAPTLELSALAEFVVSQFLEALQHRANINITERFEENTRQRDGLYSSDVFNAIHAAGGITEFFNITENKCNDAESWIKDLLSPTDGKPWGLDATPIPSLSLARTERVKQEAIAIAMEQGAVSPNEVEEILDAAYDEELADAQDEARKLVKRMELEMEDQMVEGKFPDAFSDFLFNFSTQPTAFLKGPLVRYQNKISWVDSAPKIKPVQTLAWFAPDPKDIYPAPNVRDIQEGAVCEIVRPSRSSLGAMRDNPGWIASAIDKVLAEPAATNPEGYSYGAADRAILENREQAINGGNAPDTLAGIEYWGDIQGKILKTITGSLGLAKGQQLEDNKFYPVTVTVFGEHVVRAILNPDPTGEKPYYACSYQRNPGSVWGKSLPEKMRHCQKAYNVARRGAIDNMAFSSGPMMALDNTALRAGQDMSTVRARMIIHYNGDKITQSGRSAVTWYQPVSNGAEMGQAAALAKDEADETTGIPRFAHGEDGTGGAGETSSGLAMLMNNASKGIKGHIMNIDKDVLRPAIRHLYVWNMLHNEKQNIKGDAQIQARGALGALVKEQEQLRRQEMLNITNNDVDLAIIRERGRAYLLREVARGMGITDGELVPSDEEMERREQMALMAPPEEEGGGEDAQS